MCCCRVALPGADHPEVLPALAGQALRAEGARGQDCAPRVGAPAGAEEEEGEGGSHPARVQPPHEPQDTGGL